MIVKIELFGGRFIPNQHATILVYGYDAVYVILH
jgi:hypothetical protein